MTVEPTPRTNYARRHLRFGWWALVGFSLLGLALETFHALKVSWYLDVSMAPRRLMWTLTHTHGTLLALVNVGFGLMVQWLPSSGAWVRRASPCFLSAAIVLPGGFLLGGLSTHGGDPNPAAVVVPIGALLLCAGAAAAALAASGAGAPTDAEPTAGKARRRS